MGLNLRLGAGEEVVINGGIVKNNSRSRIDIEIRNRSDVLRASEMFDAQTADTPIKRLCYFVQIALVSKQHREEYTAKCFEMVGQLRDALGTSHGHVFDEVSDLLGKGEFYAADKRLKSLLATEAFLLQVACNAEKGRAA